jgi:hypothetical protein
MIRGGGEVLRLGPALLTALLLGVPRALEGRAFGDRSVFVEVAAGDPDLDAFGEALTRAVRLRGARLAFSPRGATAVITLHRSFRDRNGDEAISMSQGEGRRARRLVLHHRPERRDAAAQALLDALDARGC